MKFNRMIGTAILAGALTTVGFAAPQGQQAPQEQGRKFRAMRGHHMFGRAIAALNLTDAQKEFGKQLRADTRAQAKPILDQLRQNRQDLAAAIKSNNAGAITQLSERQGQLRGQLAAIHGKAMASFYAQLTPEQKAKLDEMREKRKERAAHRMERRQQRQNQPSTN